VKAKQPLLGGIAIDPLARSFPPATCPSENEEVSKSSLSNTIPKLRKAYRFGSFQRSTNRYGENSRLDDDQVVGRIFVALVRQDWDVRGAVCRLYQCREAHSVSIATEILLYSAERQALLPVCLNRHIRGMEVRRNAPIYFLTLK
jgi:hypothetical protein